MPNVVLPVTLTAGSNENVNDLNSNLNAIVAAINGNLDETNVPNLSAAFTSYKTILPPLTGLLSGASVAGTYTLGLSVLTNVGFVGTVAPYHTPLVNAAWFAANARTTKYRIVTTVVTNTTAPAVTFTTSMQQVTSVGGAGVPTVTAASLVAGSNGGVVATPAATTVTFADSGDFTVPPAALFGFVVATNATLATNAQAVVQAQLLMRQV